MPSFKVKVKWQKNNYSVDINTDDPPLLLKAQLFELTGVAPERQKIFLERYNTQGRILGWVESDGQCDVPDDGFQGGAYSEGTNV